MSRVIAVTGTGTEIGKTVVCAAISALALTRGERVAVIKPAQTGVRADEPGDLAEIARLAGAVTTRELARYPDPLAPDIAAARSGRPPIRVADLVASTRKLASEHDLVLIESAGGLLVRYDEDGTTFADLALACDAEALVVSHAGLGALNWAALTVEALRHRQSRCLGLVVGQLPAELDLATECNLDALPKVTGVPLLGVLPHRMSTMDRRTFVGTARESLHPHLGGLWRKRVRGNSV
ncbi:MAG: ATP-dependent dethiobiotin synthetase BioD [Sciscionella sp.]|nr:ATP-dependent dethiobiotin synthetase BioD [Sciscionella sp.]